MSSSFSIHLFSHVYVGSMFLTAFLYLARWYTSSSDSCLSLRFSFTQSIHLRFGLPLRLLPRTSISITLLPTYSSSLRFTWPNHCSVLSCIFLEISTTFVIPLIFSFLILSILVTPHIHLSIFILPTSNFFSCLFFNGHVSAPYIIAGLTTVLYTLPLIFTFILRSHSTPDMCAGCKTQCSENIYIINYYTHAMHILPLTRPTSRVMHWWKMTEGPYIWLMSPWHLHEFFPRTGTQFVVAMRANKNKKRRELFLRTVRVMFKHLARNAWHKMVRIGAQWYAIVRLAYAPVKYYWRIVYV